jgi:uncharacterized protein (TIGR00369 family)
MHDGVPANYTPFLEGDGYIGLSGPYYWTKEPSGLVTYGFQSDARHANPNGVLHGAAITTFVDTFLGHAVVSATGRPCATVALNTQFVAGIPTGSWISGRANVRKLTRTMAFLDAEVSAQDTLLLTATAIFRVFEDRSGASKSGG